MSNTSEAFQAWRAKHIADGCRIAKVAAMFYEQDPSRWGAYKDKEGIVESYLKWNERPDQEYVIPKGAP